MKYTHLMILASLGFSTIAVPRAVKSTYLIVTPANAPMSCSIRSEENPPRIENEMVKFKVVVTGGTSPYEWRLPLYKYNNGFNPVAVNRIGKKVKLDASKAFALDLSVTDLEMTDQQTLKLTLRSQEKLETSCSLSAIALKNLARTTPANSSLIMEGGVTR